MFKPTPTFVWKVNFEWPEAGKFAKHTIRCKFQRLSVPEMEQLNRDSSPSEDDDESQMKWLGFITEALDRVLVEVNEDDIELTDDDGEKLSQADIQAWCKGDPTISVAMYEAYQQAITGRKLELGN